jgi:RNA polymerase sigma-70 factor, ECF subfamily
MNRGIDLGVRSESMAFRLELADFGAFYERTYDLAYRTALGIVREPALAADVTQEAFVSAYQSRGRFRGEAPSGAWLHKIVVNKALSAIRRNRATRTADGDADLTRFITPDNASETASRLAMLGALDRLSPRQRAAVILRYYHGYDYATIAQILETTSTNVGAMLSRGLDQLKVVLEPIPDARTERGTDR